MLSSTSTQTQACVTGIPSHASRERSLPAMFIVDWFWGVLNFLGAAPRGA